MERVKAKLRHDIGDMLPDDAVEQMVQRVVNEEFFTKKQVPDPKWSGPSYDRPLVEKPSAFQEMVMEAAKPIIERKAAAVIRASISRIETQIGETVEKGVMEVALKVVDSIIVDAMRKNMWQVQTEIENTLRNRGLLT